MAGADQHCCKGNLPDPAGTVLNVPETRQDAAATLSSPACCLAEAMIGPGILPGIQAGADLRWSFRRRSRHPQDAPPRRSMNRRSTSSWRYAVLPSRLPASWAGKSSRGLAGGAVGDTLEVVWGDALAAYDFGPGHPLARSASS